MTLPAVRTANDTEQTSPPGYDVPRVEAWIAAHVSALTPPLRWLKLEGGHSNLTYLIEDTRGRRAVIRRPPLGELLPKAHDMGREWALISALAPTPVPVPAALGFCEDLAVTGARFYVMGHVNGRPLYSSADTERLVPKAQRPTLAHSFIDVLADLHAVDPDAVGLGDLGKRDSYVGRQLSTWYKSWTASAGPAQYDDPRAHAIQKTLLTHLPEQEPARIVHGDYGLHNCLVGPDCTIAAVVDWEISTLGDPLADLAYALNPWPDPSDAVAIDPASATAPEGFPPRSALAKRYAERTGRDLSRLDYYVAFNRWKSAAIIHGVYARYMEGKKSHEGVDLESLRQRIDGSLAAADAALKRIGL
jgi:aminoglycoside phosphotransferase (APT) family kinase protein